MNMAAGWWARLVLLLLTSLKSLLIYTSVTAMQVGSRYSFLGVFIQYHIYSVCQMPSQVRVMFKYKGNFENSLGVLDHMIHLSFLQSILILYKFFFFPPSLFGNALIWMPQTLKYYLLLLFDRKFWFSIFLALFLTVSFIFIKCIHELSHYRNISFFIYIFFILFFSFLLFFPVP